jgi:hypothetical protein
MTLDFRHLLGEVLQTRFGVTRADAMEQVFPGFTVKPTGVMTT